MAIPEPFFLLGNDPKIFIHFPASMAIFLALTLPLRDENWTFSGSFIAFANHPDGVTPAYRRFLTNRIKKNWGLEGLPMRIFIMRSGG